ncbi:MAG TPA: hypothetical protein DIU14_00670 [Actinobacteria bacterium]|nr:hypothetical protein [Actinomycetota bacterium]
MTVPAQVAAWAREREKARAARDFAAADGLRERIRDAGFEVIDGPEGSTLAPLPGESTPAYRGSHEVPSLLEAPPAFRASVQWVVEGWPQDVRRGIAAFDAHHPPGALQHVVVDLIGAEWPDAVDLVRMDAKAGWAEARNAGLRRSNGAVVIVADGSIEPSGDVLTPVESALADPAVGVTGPFGIVSPDLHHFDQSPGPDVDAVEAYLMAFPRGPIEQGLRFDPKFRFYRTADIELSFQVKARGLRATVTEVPVTKHEHRMWSSTSEAERDRLSKRNFYRFLDRWRGRTDLLVSGSPPAHRHDHGS